MPAAAAATAEIETARRLSVLRHAKSSWKQAGQSDFERPLNSRGARDAPEMGRRCAAWPEPPSLIVTSAAQRAVQTTRALIEAWATPPEIVLDEALYLASADQLLESVLALDSMHSHVMLVGHNPGLTDFVNRFAAAGVANLPTCALIRMRLWVPEWSDAGWDSAGVELIDTPKAPAG